MSKASDLVIESFMTNMIKTKDTAELLSFLKKSQSEEIESQKNLGEGDLFGVGSIQNILTSQALQKQNELQDYIKSKSSSNVEEKNRFRSYLHLPKIYEKVFKNIDDYANDFFTKRKEELSESHSKIYEKYINKSKESILDNNSNQLYQEKRKLTESLKDQIVDVMEINRILNSSFNVPVNEQLNFINKYLSMFEKKGLNSTLPNDIKQLVVNKETEIQTLNKIHKVFPSKPIYSFCDFTTLFCIFNKYNPGLNVFTNLKVYEEMKRLENKAYFYGSIASACIAPILATGIAVSLKVSFSKFYKKKVSFYYKICFGSMFFSQVFSLVFFKYYYLAKELKREKSIDLDRILGDTFNTVERKNLEFRKLNNSLICLCESEKEEVSKLRNDEDNSNTQSSSSSSNVSSIFCASLFESKSRIKSLRRRLKLDDLTYLQQQQKSLTSEDLSKLKISTSFYGMLSKFIFMKDDYESKLFGTRNPSKGIANFNQIYTLHEKLNEYQINREVEYLRNSAVISRLMLYLSFLERVKNSRNKSLYDSEKLLSKVKSTFMKIKFTEPLPVCKILELEVIKKYALKSSDKNTITTPIILLMLGAANQSLSELHFVEKVLLSSIYNNEELYLSLYEHNKTFDKKAIKHDYKPISFKETILINKEINYNELVKEPSKITMMPSIFFTFVFQYRLFKYLKYIK